MKSGEQTNLRMRHDMVVLPSLAMEVGVTVEPRAEPRCGQDAQLARRTRFRRDMVKQPR